MLCFIASSALRQRIYIYYYMIRSQTLTLSLWNGFHAPLHQFIYYYFFKIISIYFLRNNLIQIKNIRIKANFFLTILPLHNQSVYLNLFIWKSFYNNKISFFFFYDIYVYIVCTFKKKFYFLERKKSLNFFLKK